MTGGHCDPLCLGWFESSGQIERCDECADAVDAEYFDDDAERDAAAWWERATQAQRRGLPVPRGPGGLGTLEVAQALRATPTGRVALHDRGGPPPSRRLDGTPAAPLVYCQGCEQYTEDPGCAVGRCAEDYLG